ncbi:lasso peptide biosynthesis B2 protein [Verrucomicrobium sp. 3C]|uniref:lasso peptide biosynthesis B2 protein n=1 Tax=Verrucomicrobium sp. 3C TaxID=1134055 RepID=UPI00036E6FE2|nr:lasso peptide biosynthesis B2 protein [Verrucomicrobium sp. 3C]
MNRTSDSDQNRALPSWRELFLVAEAWLTLLWVAATLRTRWRKRLFVMRSLPAERRLTQTQVQRVTCLVNAAANRHVKPMTCLERALTLQSVLRRRGCRTTLRFGVQKDENADLAAHAWLEGVSGLDDPLSSRFVPLQPLQERP